MSLIIETDYLKKKKDPFEEYAALMGNVPGQQPGGPQRGGGVTASGIPEDAVLLAKDKDIFTANKVYGEGTSGAGMASTFSTQSTNSDVQIDGATPNQPTGDVTVQPPNTSGLTTVASALQGAEQNSGSDPQGGATDDGTRQENYQNSHNGVMESLSFTPTQDSSFSSPSLDSLLGKAPEEGVIPPEPGETEGTGEATLGSPDNDNGVNPDGDNVDNPNGEDNPVNGNENGDNNVNGSGNEEDKNDPANGNVDDSDKPTEQETLKQEQLEAERKAQEEAEKRIEEQRKKEADDKKAA